MKPILWLAILAFTATLELASAQQASPLRPPVGVPADAKHFQGKWFRVYLEKGGWKRAKEKCARLGGQLATVPDEATQGFVKQLADDLQLWLGATDEKVQRLWVWVDGTPMNFSAWAPGQPSHGEGKEHYLQTFGEGGRWNDAVEDDRHVVGFICEWKPK